MSCAPTRTPPQPVCPPLQILTRVAVSRLQWLAGLRDDSARESSAGSYSSRDAAVEDLMQAAGLAGPSPKARRQLLGPPSVSIRGQAHQGRQLRAASGSGLGGFDLIRASALLLP